MSLSPETPDEKELQQKDPRPEQPTRQEPSITDKDPRVVQKAFSGTLVLKCERVLCKERGSKILPDVTVFLPAEDFWLECKNLLAKEAKRLPPLAASEWFPHTIDLYGNVQFQGASEAKTCRLHAALCFGGTYYAITVRSGPHPGACLLPISTEAGQEASQPQANLETPSGGTATLGCDYVPGTLDGCSFEKTKGVFDFKSLEKKQLVYPGAKPDYYATTLYEISEVLSSVIFSEKRTYSGLVLVVGGTGSGKTEILNGLLARYLANQFAMPPQSRPRVIAVGDPPETRFYGESLEEAGKTQTSVANFDTRLIDYVARVLLTDVASVKAALRDALRETTSAYIVSELRDNADFRATLDFAATGQLIFATAHNTSLIDALRKLMRLSFDADTPSNRALLAQRLRAVIHLKPFRFGGGKWQITLPTVWIGNPIGTRNFVSDGLASILPAARSSHGAGVLGMAWAIEELERQGKFRDIQRPFTDGDLLDLQRKAHRHDLENH